MNFLAFVIRALLMGSLVGLFPMLLGIYHHNRPLAKRGFIACIVAMFILGLLASVPVCAVYVARIYQKRQYRLPRNHVIALVGLGVVIVVWASVLSSSRVSGFVRHQNAATLTVTAVQRDRVTALLRNRSDEGIFYGVAYHVQFFDGANWRNVPWREQPIWISIGLSLPPGRGSVYQFGLQNLVMVLPGRYRVVRNVSVGGWAGTDNMQVTGSFFWVPWTRC